MLTPIQAFDSARWQHFVNCRKTVKSVLHNNKSFFMVICQHCSGTASSGKQCKRMSLSTTSHHHIIDLLGLDLSSMIQSMNVALSRESKASRKNEMKQIVSHINVMMHGAVQMEPENVGRRIFAEIASSSHNETETETEMHGVCMGSHWDHFRQCKNIIETINQHGERVEFVICGNCSGKYDQRKRLAISSKRTRHRLFKFLKKDPVQIIEEVGNASRLDRISRCSEIKRIVHGLNEELCQAIAQDPACASTIFKDLSWRQSVSPMTAAAGEECHDSEAAPNDCTEVVSDESRWEHFIQCDSIVTNFRIDRGRQQMLICNRCSGKSFTKANPKRMVFKARSRVLRDIVGINLSEFEGLQESLSDKQEQVAKYLSSRFHDVIRSDPEGSGRQLFNALSPMFTNIRSSVGKRTRDSELSTTLLTENTPDVDGHMQHSPSSSQQDHHEDDYVPAQQQVQEQSQQVQEQSQQVQEQSQQDLQTLQTLPHDEEDMARVLPDAYTLQHVPQRMPLFHEPQRMPLFYVPQRMPLFHEPHQQAESSSSTAAVERVLRTIDASGRGQRLVARLKLDDCCSLLLLENPLPSRTHEMVQQQLYSLLCGSDIGALTHVLHRFSAHKSCIENIVSRLGEEQCLGLLLSETNPLPNATLDMIEDHLLDSVITAAYSQ